MQKVLTAVVSRPTDAAGNPGPVSQLQDNADTNTMVRQLLAKTAPAATAGTSTADLVAVLKPMFDALPAAVRAAIIK